MSISEIRDLLKVALIDGGIINPDAADSLDDCYDLQSLAAWLIEWAGFQDDAEAHEFILDSIIES